MSARDFDERFSWAKISAPRAWRPKEGEALSGYYAGRTLKNGSFGQYEIVLVHVPYEGVYTVSGVAIINLIDAARIELDHPIRIVFAGKKKFDGDKSVKLFELYVARLPRGVDEDRSVPVRGPQ